MVLKKAAQTAKEKVEKAELTKLPVVSAKRSEIIKKIDKYFSGEEAIKKTDYDYPDFREDKNQYLGEVKSVIREMLEDNIVTTEELSTTISKLRKETARFRGEALKAQHDFEKEKFDKWNSEELPVLVGNANFKEAFKHIKENTERLEKLGFQKGSHIMNLLKNAEIDTKTHKGLYDLLDAGVKVEGLKGANVIVRKSKDKITLKKKESVDTYPQLYAPNSEKTYRWTELLSIIQQKNLKLTHVDDSEGKPLGLKDVIDEKEWNEMQAEKERILVDEMVGQINHVLENFVQNKPEETDKIPKERILKVFKKHPLNGHLRLSTDPLKVRATAYFNALPAAHKVQILQGVFMSIDMQKMEEKIDELAKNNETVALYKKAEKFMEGGLPYLGYKYFLQCDTKLAEANQNGVKMSELQEGVDGYLFTRKEVGEQLKTAGLQICNQARQILLESGVPNKSRPPLLKRDPAYDFIEYMEAQVKNGVTLTNALSSAPLRSYPTTRNILRDIIRGLHPSGYTVREAVRKSGTWAAQTVMEEKHYKNYDWMIERAHNLRRRGGIVLPMRSDLKATDLKLAEHLYRIVATNSMAENGLTDTDEYQRYLQQARDKIERQARGYKEKKESKKEAVKAAIAHSSPMGASLHARSGIKSGLTDSISNIVNKAGESLAESATAFDNTNYSKDKDPYYKHALKVLKKNNPNFKELPKEEQALLASQMRESIVNNIAEQNAKSMYLDHNIDKAAKLSRDSSRFKGKDYITAAKQYVDMTNHFNSKNPLKWADATWDRVVEETVVTSTGMIIAGGMSNLVGSGLKLALTKLAGKGAGKVAQLGIWAAKVGTESVVYDLASEGFQALRTGEFSKKSFNERMAYSLALSFSLNAGGLGKIFGKVGSMQSKATQMITPWAKQGQLKGFKGMIQKSAQVGASMGTRAGIMTGLSYALDPYHPNESILKTYFRNLRTMATVSVGHRLFNAATGNAIPRAMQSIDHKTQMAALAGSATPKNAESIRTLQDMVKRNEMPAELALRVASKGAKANDIMQMRNLALKARTALIEGKNPQSILTKTEFNKLNNLATKLGIQGETVRSMLTENVDPAAVMAAKVRSEAMDSLVKKAGDIKTSIKDLTGKAREAWSTFIDRCEGNYQRFVEKYPKLKKHMPPNLKDAALKISVLGISALTGTPAVMGLVEKRVIDQRSEALVKQAADINTAHKREVLNSMTKGLDVRTRELIESTYFDNATGMLNRNGLKFLDNMIEKKRDFSVVSYDADHFKAYNDVLGDAYGDRTIKVIAKNMNQVVRDLKDAGHESHSVRMGGEEIVLFTTAPRGLIKTKMEAMKLKLKNEILSTIKIEAREEMAELIYRNKYAALSNGRPRAYREIGGSTAGISEFKGEILKKAELTISEVRTKMLQMVDAMVEHAKNMSSAQLIKSKFDQSGRGNIYLDPRSSVKNSKRAPTFSPKNDLTKTQNRNVENMHTKYAKVVNKEFINRLKKFNSLPLSPRQKARLLNIIENVEYNVAELSNTLRQIGIEGNTTQAAVTLKNEYLQAVKNYGSYTGSSTQTRLEEATQQEYSPFYGQQMKTIDIPSFKSINETIGHTGGDLFLTYVHQDIITPAIKRAGILPRDIIVAQKGPEFNFTTSKTVKPGQLKRFQSIIKKTYEAKAKEFFKRVDAGGKAKYTKKREEWIRKNKAKENPEIIIRDLYKISIL